MNPSFIQTLAQLIVMALLLVGVSTLMFKVVSALRAGLQRNSETEHAQHQELASCESALDFLLAKMHITKLDETEAAQLSALSVRKGELMTALRMHPTGALAN